MHIFEIHFYCPSHRRDIGTGIQVDSMTFQRTRLSVVQIICPHCERIHRYLMADSHHQLLEPNDALSIYGSPRRRERVASQIM